MGSLRRDKYIKWRDARAYYYRRVPKDILAFDERRFIEKSLETDDPSTAEVRRDALNAATEEMWQGFRVMESSHHSIEKFEEAVKHAVRIGFPYKPMDQVVNVADQELIERLEAIEKASAPKPAAEALLGTHEMPSLTLSEALETFWSLSQDRIIGKNQDQRNKWHTPRKRCVANFIKAVADKPLKDLTRNDILDFRSFWLERIQAGKARADTANKDFTHLTDIFQTVCDAYQLELDNPFRGLRLKEKAQNRRRSLSREEIINSLFKKNFLDGLT